MNKNVDRTELAEGSIDLKLLLDTVWKYKWFTVGLAVAAMLIAMVRVMFFTQPTFTTRGELYVSNKSDSQMISTSMQSNDIESARKMSQTAVRILKTNDFRKIVSDATGGKYSPEAVGARVSISADDTEILTITVTSPSAAETKEIADAFLMCAPDHLKGIFNTGDAKVVDHPKDIHAPNSKHILRHVLLGFIIGALIAVAVIFVYTLFDKKVHNSTEAVNRYDLPLLGEIPR